MTATNIREFLRGEAGTVALTGALLMPILTMLGIATVDFSAITTTEKEMQKALDAASIVAAQTPDIEDPGAASEIQRLGENYLRNTLLANGTRIDRFEAEFVYDASADKIRATATYKPSSFFLDSVLKVEEMHAGSVVTRPRPVKLEIAMALDVSGSMEFGINSESIAAVGSRRIDALSEGVDALLETIAEEDGLEARIAAVPYSSAVDVGKPFDDPDYSPAVGFELAGEA